jgi:hypothetical protein
MSCHQCGRRAIYLVGPSHDIPLCLDCNFKFAQIAQQQLEDNERMMNFAADQMTAISGFRVGPRFPPRPRPVVYQGVTLTNINVENSVVGTINTGSVGTVDQSITVLRQLGEPAVADALKALSEAVLQSGDLSPNQRNEVVEILGAVAREAATPQHERQATVARSLIEKGAAITSLASDIADACAKYWPALLALFNWAST